MAEGWDPSYLSPQEEQYIREAEADGDLDQQLQLEKELASHKLWMAFQDSATAVAHLFRDCQQQAGLAAWVPFHESASAVTELYRGASEICRQCMESGSKYGQRKRNKELIAWAKKKRKVIRREELLAFLLDKPYPDTTPSSPLDRHEELCTDLTPPVVNHQHQRSTPTVSYQPGGVTNYSHSSPRRRALFREDPSSCVMMSSSSEIFGVSGRKRPANSSSSCCSSGVQFDFGQDTPVAKRMRL